MLLKSGSVFGPYGCRLRGHSSLRCDELDFRVRSTNCDIFCFLRILDGFLHIYKSRKFDVDVVDAGVAVLSPRPLALRKMPSRGIGLK